jgi:hypothetical protein
MLLPLDKISTTIVINTQIKQETKTKKSILSRATCTCKIISFLHQSIVISFALKFNYKQISVMHKATNSSKTTLSPIVYSLVTGLVFDVVKV